MSQLRVAALSESCSKFLGRQLRIHCSDSEWPSGEGILSRTNITYCEGAAVAQWLQYSICVQGVVGSNPQKANGGDRKGIRP